MRAEVGQACTFVDSLGRERAAIVTSSWKNGDESKGDGVNVVVVDINEAKTDTYGRQVERFTSVPHQSTQPAPGMYWK